ncbi:MAG: hypothetical protein ABIT83_19440 [Massilia sp.]
MKTALLSIALAASLVAGAACATEPVRTKAPARTAPAAKAAPEAAAPVDAAKPAATPEAGKLRADIEYWTSKYDGNDLRGGANRCPVPRIPAVSKQNEEIIKVVKNYEAWQACHKAYLDKLQGEAPLTKRIPPAVAKQMSEAETAQSATYLKGVHEQLVADAGINAGMVQADYAAWRSSTNNYIKEFKAVLKKAEEQEKEVIHDEPETGKRR